MPFKNNVYADLSQALSDLFPTVCRFPVPKPDNSSAGHAVPIASRDLDSPSGWVRLGSAQKSCRMVSEISPIFVSLDSKGSGEG